MERIGVRDLRQNASRVVSEVERHGPVVVTVSGRDAVVIAPLTGHRWVSVEEALRVWDAPVDGAVWLTELEEARDSDVVFDPWRRPQ